MKVLFLGNSFTQVNDLPQMVSRLSGWETRKIVRGGAYLRDFCNPGDELNAGMEEAFREKWDYVVIQEQSFNAVGNREDYLKHARILCDRIKAEGAVPVIYATWAYEENTPKLKNTGLSYARMDGALAQSFQQAAEENDAILAPVGAFFTKVRFVCHLYHPTDWYHPSPAATFLAACVITHAIAEKLPFSAWKPEEISEETAAFIRKTVETGKSQLRQAAFEGKAPFLKGNLHCHTTRSDGKGTPEAVITQYGHMGYDFLALTDHRYYNFKDYAPEAGVLLIPGMEMDGNIPDPGIHCVHVVSVGPEKGNGFEQDQRVDSLKLTKVGDAQPMVDQALEAHNLPILCHPEWSGTGAAEIEELQGFSHMEVWNSGCVVECDMDDDAAYWDELLCHGRVIYGVASDDGHAVQHHGLGYVKVRAEKNVDAILDALKKGAFYASCGPEIYDFFVEDGTATVICSPASKIVFRHFRVPYPIFEGKGIQAAKTPIRPGTKYIRAEVTDAQGRKAWTNPIFLDQ